MRWASWSSVELKDRAALSHLSLRFSQVKMTLCGDIYGKGSKVPLVMDQSMDGLCCHTCHSQLGCVV